MAASERPPTQSGGPPGCAGPGSISMSCEGEEPPRERAAAREQRSQRAHRLVRPRAALAHRHADRLEVLLPLAAHADAEDHPAARHVVEGRELLRHDARMPQRQQHHAGADRDPLRDGGERRQRDDDVEDRVAVRDVVAGPDRVVAERLGRLRELAEDARVGCAVHVLPAALDAEGDIHVRPPTSLHACS